MSGIKKGAHGSMVCEELHHSLHYDGLMHNLSGYNESITTSATVEFLWDTPATEDVSMTFNLVSSESFRLTFLENVTATANGSTLPTFNMNRSFQGVSLATAFYAGPTAMTGTALSTTLLISSSGNRRAGTGSFSIDEHWTWKKGTRCGVRIENRSATVASFAYTVHIHEG